MTSCIKLGAPPQVNHQGLLTCYGHKKPAVACLMAAYCDSTDTKNPLEDHDTRLADSYPCIVFAGKTIPIKSLNSETERRMNMTLVLCQEGALAYVKHMPQHFGDRLIYLSQHVHFKATNVLYLRWFPKIILDGNYGVRLPFLAFNSNTYRTEILQHCIDCTTQQLLQKNSVADFIKSYHGVLHTTY